MSTNNFYRAFEERYRGSRELIGHRLKAYLPFITPLRKLYEPTKAVDLGCGRGEWLELLITQGFEPHGVDLDTGMLAACIERGFSVTEGDAIEYLKSLEDESQSIISGFHIAEHIAFDKLEDLVNQSLRILRPGGLLILETPNPENLIVGTSSFYLDPTHLRPIPPPLLSFLPEHHGFSRVKTIRLQESERLKANNEIGLFDVFNGVSPDYAIVAQKKGSFEIMTSFDSAFNEPYGLELEFLAKRYDQKIEEKIQASIAEARAEMLGMSNVLTQITSLTDDLLASNAELAHKNAEIVKLQRETEYISQVVDTSKQDHERAIHAAFLDIKNLQMQIQSLDLEKKALYQSFSWRITSPFRWLVDLIPKKSKNMSTALESKGLLSSSINFMIQKTVQVLQYPISVLIKTTLKNGRYSQKINRFLINNLPGLHNQLRDIAYQYRLIKPTSYSPPLFREAPPQHSSFHRRAKNTSRGPRSKFVENRSDHSLDLEYLLRPQKESEFDFKEVMKNLKAINTTDIESFKFQNSASIKIENHSSS